MDFEKPKVKVYRVTTKKIIERLTQIKDCSVDELKDEIIDAFDGYDYRDIEDLTGFDAWPDITKEGTYDLIVKIDHEDAYEFTLHTKVENKKASIENVL